MAAPVLLLLLVVLGFCGMVGRAARVGFVPWGTGGFGLTGPPGELEGDVALRRVAGSGLASPRGGVFSREPGSDLTIEPVGDLFSEVVGLAAEINKKTIFLHFFYSSKIGMTPDPTEVAIHNQTCLPAVSHGPRNNQQSNIMTSCMPALIINS